MNVLIFTRMKIKNNDRVKVQAGKDRGKDGKVIQVFPPLQKIVVDGVNKSFKHLRSQKSGEKGQRVEFNGPISIANVSLICPKCEKITRVGYKILDNKEKVRMCNKCKEVID